MFRICIPLCPAFFLYSSKYLVSRLVLAQVSEDLRAMGILTQKDKKGLKSKPARFNDYTESKFVMEKVEIDAVRTFRTASVWTFEARRNFVCLCVHRNLTETAKEKIEGHGQDQTQRRQVTY